MRLLAFALLLTLAACRTATVETRPSIIPDTIYTASGSIPVVMVDSIATDDPRKLIVGRLDYLNRRLYIARAARDSMVQRKVLEHERCHQILAESGLQMHFLEAPWLVELICDAFSNAAMSQLERGKP